MAAGEIIMMFSNLFFVYNNLTSVDILAMLYAYYLLCIAINIQHYTVVSNAKTISTYIGMHQLTSIGQRVFLL